MEPTLSPPRKRRRLNCNDSYSIHNQNNCKNERKHEHDWVKLGTTSMQTIFQFVAPKFLWGRIPLVCTNWNDIITDDMFIQGYYNLHCKEKLNNSLPFDTNWISKSLSLESISREMKRRNMKSNTTIRNDLSLYEIVMEEANELSLNEAKKKMKFRQKSRRRGATKMDDIQRYQIGMQNTKQFQPKIHDLFKIAKKQKNQKHHKQTQKQRLKQNQSTTPLTPKSNQNINTCNTNDNNTNTDIKNMNNSKKQYYDEISKIYDSNDENDGEDGRTTLLRLKRKNDNKVRCRKRSLFSLMFIRHITMDEQFKYLCQNCLSLQSTIVSRIPYFGNSSIKLCSQCEHFDEFRVISMKNAARVYGIFGIDLENIFGIKPFYYIENGNKKDEYLRNLNRRYRMFAPGVMVSEASPLIIQRWEEKYRDMFVHYCVLKCIYKIKYDGKIESCPKLDKEIIYEIEDKLVNLFGNKIKNDSPFELRYKTEIELLHGGIKSSFDHDHAVQMVQDVCYHNEVVAMIKHRFGSDNHKFS